MKGRLLKIAYFSVPVAAVLLSILALNSGPLLKRMAGPAREIPALITEVSTLVAADRWTEAMDRAASVDQRWERIRTWLASSSDAQDLKGFEVALSELRGALEATDRQQVKIIQRRLTAFWAEIGS